MPEFVIAPVNTPAPDELKIRALNIRTANGNEPAQGGGFIPAGRISVTITPGSYVNGAWEIDRPPASIDDVEGWLAALATANDSLAATAAAYFTEVNAKLKWLCALRLSQLNRAQRPTPL